MSHVVSNNLYFSLDKSILEMPTSTPPPQALPKSETRNARNTGICSLSRYIPGPGKKRYPNQTKPNYFYPSPVLRTNFKVFECTLYDFCGMRDSFYKQTLLPTPSP
uniref:Uncharacterized protein n=1 Tax=Sphaerodactylus townsendi TaxID=933632 RepID=A0ACB8E9Y1_9SAUR